MSLKKLTIDTDYFEKVLDKLSSEDLQTIYNNIMSVKYILDFKDNKLKKTFRENIKIKGKPIICECCGKKMSNLYFYHHRTTEKYKKFMELRSKIKVLETEKKILETNK
jgi:hypothetical protein